MTTIIKSKYGVCKKIKNSYKNLWGLEKKETYRSLIFKRKHKTTSFSKLLNIKQALKFFYSNIKELTFKKYAFFSVNSQSKTIDKLVSILESRVDTALFRSCFVTSFYEAKQLISHKFVLINNKYVISPNIVLSNGDILKLKFCKRKLSVLNTKIFREKLLSRSLPSYIEIDWQNFSFFFLWDINFKTAYFPVELSYQHICRYYK